MFLYPYEHIRGRGYRMDALIIALIPLLCQVESGNNPAALGDYSSKTGEYRAVGCLQMWKICVDDVNRISGRSYTYADRLSREKSVEMATIYLRHYGRHYERTTGKKVTLEILARNYNGSPVNGYKNPKTLKYWRKAQKQLQKARQK